MDSFMILYSLMLLALVLLSGLWTWLVLRYRCYLVRRWPERDERPSVFNVPDGGRRWP